MTCTRRYCVLTWEYSSSSFLILPRWRTVSGWYVTSLVNRVLESSPNVLALTTSVLETSLLSLITLQRRNFGLKSGVPIQKKNEVPLGPEAKGEENVEEISASSSNSGICESVLISPSEGLGQSSGRKWFYCNLISVDRFCWQQILHLLVLKSEGYCTPQSKKWGYRYHSPRTLRKLRL